MATKRQLEAALDESRYMESVWARKHSDALAELEEMEARLRQHKDSIDLWTARSKEANEANKATRKNMQTAEELFARHLGVHDNYMRERTGFYNGVKETLPAFAHGQLLADLKALEAEGVKKQARRRLTPPKVKK